MSKKLTLDDLIIEEHPGGQNCRSCPFDMIACCNTSLVDGLDEDVCFTHTITLKPTTDEPHI